VAEANPQKKRLKALAAVTDVGPTATSQGRAGAARPSESPNHKKHEDRKSRWWLRPSAVRGVGFPLAQQLCSTLEYAATAVKATAIAARPNTP
jgi:hypothetical protein